jgi:hypothetical protein
MKQSFKTWTPGIDSEGKDVVEVVDDAADQNSNL